MGPVPRAHPALSPPAPGAPHLPRLLLPRPLLLRPLLPPRLLPRLPRRPPPGRLLRPPPARCKLPRVQTELNLGDALASASAPAQPDSHFPHVCDSAGPRSGIKPGTGFSPFGKSLTSADCTGLCDFLSVQMGFKWDVFEYIRGRRRATGRAEGLLVGR